MLRLLLLGRVSITDADRHTLERVLRQPKRFALLVYLLLAGGPVRRDTLLRLFWPGLDDQHGRRALSQAIYYLVRALGTGVIVGGRSEVIGIAHGEVACDVNALEAALAAGNAAAAVDLYQGELLPGFFLDGCPDWQDWIDRERTRLSTAVTSAAVALSRKEQLAGNHLAAVQWARRAAAWSPLTEGLLRDVMSLLARVGDSTAALHEYERHARWLREAFDDEPEPETRSLAARIEASEVVGAEDAETRSGGSALPAEKGVAVPVPPGSGGSARPAHERTGTGERGAPGQPIASKRTRRLAVLAMSFLALLLIAGVVLLRRRSRPDPAETDRVRIAVIPFGELGTPSASLGRVAAALTSAVADQLAEVPTFEVLPVHDTARRNSADADPESSRADAGFLLSGAVTGSGALIRVRYSLIDSRSGAIERTDTLDRAVADSLSFVDDAARAISFAVRAQVGRTIRVAQWEDKRAPGRLVEEADWQSRRARALQGEGALAAAQQALNACDSLLASAAERAPRWPEPWIERARTAERLGLLRMLAAKPDPSQQERAWSDGIRFATIAIGIDPKEGRAWEIRGVLRYMLWGTLAAEARPRDELLDTVAVDLQHATALNHLLPRAWSILSAALATQGRLADAAEAAEEALEADRYLDNREEILLRLYETSLDLGRDSAAARWCDEVNRRYEASVVAASCTLGLLAWSATPPRTKVADPWRLLRAVRDNSAPVSEFRPELEMQVAAVLARRGDRDGARAVIRRAAREAGPEPSPPVVRLEALALATAGDRIAADSAAREFARFDPAAARRLTQSRAFQSLEGLPPRANVRARRQFPAGLSRAARRRPPGATATRRTKARAASAARAPRVSVSPRLRLR